MSAILSANAPLSDIDEAGFGDEWSTEDDAVISASLAYVCWWDSLPAELRERFPRAVAQEAFVAGYLSLHRELGRKAEGGAA